MPRKIYDIKPPKVARKTERDIKDFLKTEKKKNSRVVSSRPIASKRKEVKKFPWKIILPAGALCFVILIGFLYFKLQKATIEIWPNVQTLSYTQTIKADKAANGVNINDQIIPAKIIEIEKTDTQEFLATGNASDGGKATGTVTMYNTLGSALTLKNGTHLLSDSGKYFITLSKISIPGGSKAKPGSVQVKVQATEGGDSYNIGPANFSVPKLSGTNYYYTTYAVSKEAMTGGYSGDVKKVIDDDINQAEESLIKNLSSLALEEIKNQLGSEYIVLDDAVFYKTEDTSPSVKSGTVTDKFDFTATVKASALVFKQSDLDKICKDYIISQMQQDQTILDGSFKKDFKLDKIDIAKENLTIKVDFSAGTYKTINKNSLTLSLIGKNANEITETINNNLADSVSRVNVEFWPFWVKKAPNNQKYLKIDLKF